MTAPIPPPQPHAAHAPDEDPQRTTDAPVHDAVPARQAASLPALPCVHLRDPGGESLGPVVRTSSADMPATQELPPRLQLLGEIARGGMGAILKGRDTDLGREIAIKVLLQSQAGRADSLQRFVEEAQITGQLQHPGIVPVYELGRLPDLRPYFTMKLVKGKTLAALLAARSDPAQDRSRFVGIFAQVCQTLAYTHARGVIHRDLKPSNIMVGAFGEVQLMDWGLAKVLAEGGAVDQKTVQQRPDVSFICTQRSAKLDSEGSDSHTQSGSLLGTPAYIAPEQARGDVDLVDQRSDVFGLGAILCEILTGQPPFTGRAAEAARKAQIAKLEDAYARLDASGAEAELVRLAKWCLAAEPWDRPGDAGKVAQEVAAYLDSVAERLRQAELARAAEQVRAEEEAKRRRMTLGLAAAVLTLVVAGGSAAAWWWQQRTSVSRDVEAALAEALQHQAAGRWSEARAALERADGRLGGTGPEVLRDRVRQARADVDMVHQLDEIRLRQMGAYTAYGRFDLAGAEQLYALAFAAYGLDVSAPEAAARLRDSAIREALLAGLDDWMRVKPRTQRAALRALADAADDNAWRLSCRAALLAGDKNKLQHLAEQPEALTQSSGLLLWLGDALHDAGRVDAAVMLLQRAQQRYPGDFWLNFNLGSRLLWEVRPTRPAEAVGYFRIAVALRPASAVSHSCLGAAFAESGDRDAGTVELRQAIALDPEFAPAHTNLGTALATQGKLDEATAAFRRAIALDPKSTMAHGNLGSALATQGKLDEAAAEYRLTIALNPQLAQTHNNLGNVLDVQGKGDQAMAEYRLAIALDPKFAVAHSNLGAALSRQGKADEALAELRRAIALDPRDAIAHHRLGNLLAAQGKLDGATTEYHQAIALDPRSARYPNELAWLLATCADRPFRNPRQAVELAQKAVHLAPDNGDYYNTLGVAHYAAGHWQPAIDALQKSMELRHGGDGYDWFFLALAHAQLGHKDKARSWYDQAAAWTDRNAAHDAQLRRFRTEAARLLGLPTDAAPGKKTP